jgi:hypothetical protein
MKRSVKKQPLLFVFLAALGLAGCPAEPETESRVTAVSALDLTLLVTAPEQGAEPQAAFAGNDQYTGTILWKQGDTEFSGSAFGPETVYRAELSIAAKKGYTFPFTEAGRFTYSGAVVTQSGNTGSSLTVTIAFPATAAESVDTVVNAGLDLTALVTAPVKGAAPQSLFAEQSQYTGTIAWKQGGVEFSGSSFEPSTVYHAELSFAVKTGFTFTGVGTFTYSGAVVTQSGNTSSSLTVTIAFPSTAAGESVTLAEVINLSAQASDGSNKPATWTGDSTVTLAWGEPDDDGFIKVEITFTPTAGAVTQPVMVNRGTVSKTISGLSNGQEYTFTVRTVDAAGNKSEGTQAAATPEALYVPDPLPWPPNQKLNLDPPAMIGGGPYDKQNPENAISRIDVAQAMNWPLNEGEGVVALWPDDKRGAFTITFDDDHTENYEEMIAWKAAYDIPFTAFVRGEASSIKTGNKANLAMEKNLITAGHSVQSHTWQHPNEYTSSSEPKEPWDYMYPSTTTAEYYRDDYEHARGWIQTTLQTTLPEYRVLALAYGNGRGPEAVGRLFYIACRGVMSGRSAINRAGKTNYNHVMSDSISTAVTLTNMNSRLAAIVDPTRTIEYGGWYCVHGHTIMGDASNSTGSGNISRGVWTALFTNTLGTAASPTPLRQKLWIDTFVNVAKYGQERDSATLTVTANEAGYIKYTLTDEMDDTIFDYPLTVKFKVPDSWNAPNAVQNGQSLPCTVITEGEDKYVLVKTVPDKGEVTINEN